MQYRKLASRALALGCLALVPLGTAAAQEGGAKGAALTDANIAAIVVGANTIDVEYGKIAQSKATNPEVKQFAETMIADHTSVNEQAGNLAAKLKLTPVDNATSRALAEQAEQMRGKLRSLSGAEFDRAYMENEVAFHQTVLDAIDNALIPNAQNQELKALLEAVRPAIAAHLEHAKHLRDSLGMR